MSVQDLRRVIARLKSDATELEPGFWVANELLPEPYDERETNP